MQFIKWNLFWTDDSDGAKYGGCISASGIVNLPSNVTKRLDQLTGGELVATMDLQTGLPVFDRFLGHFHESESEPTVVIETLGGSSVRLTPDHLIHITTNSSDVIQAVQAKAVKFGDYVITRKGEKHQKDKVVQVRKSGRVEHVVAPYTESGSLVVNGIVTSCYSRITSHRMAHLALYPLRWLTSFDHDDKIVTSYIRLLRCLGNVLLPSWYFGNE